MLPRGYVDQAGGTWFYSWADGHAQSPKPYFSWGSRMRGRPLVQHPFIRFDPESAAKRTDELLQGSGGIDGISGRYTFYPDEGANDVPVQHELFEIKAHFADFIADFQARVEDAVRVPPDASLWYDTGAWTLETKDRCVIGLGTDTLLRALSRFRAIRAAYALVQTTSVLAFTIIPRSGALLLEACFNNAFHSLAEWSDAIETGFPPGTWWRRVSRRVHEERELYEPEQAHQKLMDRKPREEERAFAVKPVAVLSAAQRRLATPRMFHMALLKKPPIEVPSPSLLVHPYVLGLPPQGLWEADDFSKRLVLYSGHALFLRTMTVVSWSFGWPERLSLWKDIFSELSGGTQGEADSAPPAPILRDPPG